MSRLTFKACLGFILTLVGFHWGTQVVYNLIASEYFPTRAIVSFILIGGGAGCAIGFGLQMLKNGLAAPGPVNVLQRPDVCQCGKPLTPGAQFCAGCGRKLA